MDVFKAIVAYLSDNLTLDESEIKINSTFEELGIDSISYIELLEHIKKKYKVDVMNDSSTNFNRVSELVKYIEKMSK